MNQCIKELLLKVVPMEGEDGELMPSLHTQEDIEKFAELIIRECAGICEEHHAWTARMVGNQIKDHFGVE